MSRDRRRVMFFTEAVGGACARYRAYLPVQGLNERGWFCRTTNEWRAKMLDDFDIFVFQRINSKEGVLLIEALNDTGKITIYDMDDDLLNIPKTSPVYQLMLEKSEMVGNQLLAMARCHAVTVTTARLRELYGGISNQIKILPNLVRYASWENVPALRLGHEDSFVYGWAGSNTHADALKSLEHPLEEVFRENDKAYLVVMGDELPFKFDIKRYSVIPWGKYRLFQSVLKGFDVGLAPLGKNLFNLSKSNLRLLEMASAGISCLASDWGEYVTLLENNVSGLLCPDSPSWVSAMKRISTDDEFRKESAQSLHQLVLDKGFEIEDGIVERENYYLELIEAFYG